MTDQNFDQSKQREPFDLEQRLSAYYGPPLREQPLSASAWQHLRLRLGSQEQEGARRRARIRLHWLLRRRRTRSQSYVDAHLVVHDALERICYEARIPYNPAMLRYKLTSSAHEPAVRGSWWRKRAIRLFLPVNAASTMEQTALDVLLATGLARSVYARHSAYRPGRLLLAGIVLLACIMLILSWWLHVPLIGLPLFMALCASVACGWYRQARANAFQADRLIVLWLGRGYVCRGLHALADHSRSPRRRRWGEPSLAERITRVCGTRVEAREDQLTLVR
jgi:hypothetical protein